MSQISTRHTYVGVARQCEVQAQVLYRAAVHGQLLQLLPLLSGAQLGILLQLLLLVYYTLRTTQLSTTLSALPKLCYSSSNTAVNNNLHTPRLSLLFYHNSCSSTAVGYTLLTATPVNPFLQLIFYHSCKLYPAHRHNQSFSITTPILAQQ